MSDWSNYAAERFADSRKAKQIADQKALLDAQTIEAHAPKLWSVLTPDRIVHICLERLLDNRGDPR